jgi:hypothetical protein
VSSVYKIGICLIRRLRLAAVARLSLILYDINSPHFQNEDRPWRKEIVTIVNIFFEQLWTNQAVRRLSRTIDSPSP